MRDYFAQLPTPSKMNEFLLSNERRSPLLISNLFLPFTGDNRVCGLMIIVLIFVQPLGFIFTDIILDREDGP